MSSRSLPLFLLVTVATVVKPALRHRLAANFAAQAAGKGSEELLDMLLKAVPADKKYERPSA